MANPAATAAIAFGEVRHTRLRPARNAFRYAAFFVRVPVRHLDTAFAGLRLFSHNRWNIFSFYDADYHWNQATPELGITELLRAAGVLDVDGEIWLHTFPRVLGYVFNPVSFWFCHKADGSVRAVVCAVNNTFGEQHAYLLDHADGSALLPGEELQARKVFHVSPFCQVEGRYRFRFMTVAARGERPASSIARIDYDDNAGPLLQTSLSGRLQTLNERALLRAFFTYPLFTFGVVARIHWQALRLFLKRVRFVSKPAAPAVDVTR